MFQEELLIGKNFWNLITKMPNGYEVILEAYRRNCKYINNSLNNLKKLYLDKTDNNSYFNFSIKRKR